MLQRDNGDNSAIRNNTKNTNNNDGVDIPQPSQDEARIEIHRLKNNKSADHDGLTDELVKAVDDASAYLHNVARGHLLKPQCPLSCTEKGDPTICSYF